MVAKSEPYVKYCSNCGKKQTYGRLDHYRSAVKNDWKCKSCSSHTNNFKGKVGPIPITWFEIKRKSGIGRGYLWDLTIEDILEMYERQEGLCALTGWPISWPEKGLTSTVSIDRIDSTEGYLKENVQLLHKDVNMAKQQYTQDYFINMCKAITDKVKW
jgi:hypothetical protein